MPETISRNVRLIVYSYLDTKSVIFQIARLSKTERRRMQESFIANRERDWSVNLDNFNPLDARNDCRLFDRLQYILSVVFTANLYVSTAHGLECFCIFVKEMPNKFEKESLVLEFERLDF